MEASNKTILIIEDEHDVVDLLALNLRKAGFRTSTATDGAAGLHKARTQNPAFIILDLMLPKMPGLEICKILKTDSATRHIPILMLTAKAEEIDRIVGLEFGADDYVTKPFSPREVVLRIRAVLRRSEGKPDEEHLSAGPIVIDPARHEVSVDGKRVNLTSLEFKLLRTLMQRRGRVQERDRLLNEVWGYERRRYAHRRYLCGGCARNSARPPMTKACAVSVIGYGKINARCRGCSWV
jgi:DNA-binding response OmpR family regulator